MLRVNWNKVTLSIVNMYWEIKFLFDFTSATKTKINVK